MIQKNETGRFILINSTLTGSVPIFLRGGHIVSRASITGTLNLSNSNLILDVAFEKNSSGYYVSQGQILGLADVYNDTAFYENCFVSNCMITAKAEATITVGTSQTHYEILLSFSGDTTATYSIYLTKATFYGLDTSKCVSFSLGTSYQLKVPYSFTMNIYV